MASEVRGIAIEAMMTMIRADLACLNIKHEVFRALADPCGRRRFGRRGDSKTAAARSRLCRAPSAAEGQVVVRIGRIASRPCSDQRLSATTPTGHS